MANLTVEMAVECGSQAVEAAFLLGTSQTSEIISLRHENKKLKKVLASLKKDHGRSVGYTSPEEYEKFKAQCNEEIIKRDSKIERLESQLRNEMTSSASKSTSSKGDLDRAIEKNKRLGAELAKQRKSESQIVEKFQHALEDEKNKSSVLKTEIEEKRTKTALLEEKVKSLRDAHENPGIKQQQNQPNQKELELRGKIAKLQQKGKVASRNIGILLERIRTLEGRGKLFAIPWRKKTQPEDLYRFYWFYFESIRSIGSN